MLKTLMIIGGTLSLAIGIIGIFIPGLPTTPFLLLTTALYLRSSEKLYNKLLKTKIIGDYIREYRDAKGMTLRQKVSSIGLMWVMISASSFFFIDSMKIKVIIILLGGIGTYVMGWKVPTAGKQ
ncbi:MAG TPA: YbaN family protein [Saprospiraceae bacterium]|nr:YbaN family protein [Saprospiraceae bacterium]